MPTGQAILVPENSTIYKEKDLALESAPILFYKTKTQTLTHLAPMNWQPAIYWYPLLNRIGSHVILNLTAMINPS